MDMKFYLAHWSGLAAEADISSVSYFERF